VNNKIKCILTKSFLLVAASQIVGCSSQPESTDASAPPPLRKYIPKKTDVITLDVDDSMEGFNRGVYKFNYRFDKYVFLPAVNGYRYVMPDYAEDRVSDFMDNVSEFGHFYNNLLQGKWKATGTTLGRFCINTTVGIAGLWDPATKHGIKEKPEDFGQTLGHWGVGNGSYLMLPIAGPSNVRDGVGYAVDVAVHPVNWLDDSNSGLFWSYSLLNPIDIRKRESFRYYSTGSPFEYELVRMFYTIKREEDIKQ
jgi:phospholipid-binding lipoprotein MlaA